MRSSVVNNLVSLTVGTFLLDDFTATSTLVTSDLALSEHAWEYLLFDQTDTLTIAS
jgi:hypothetical protein